MKTKQPIGGRKISRKEALRGLGDPRTWQAEAAAVYAEFSAKPGKLPVSSLLLSKAAKHVGKLFAGRPELLNPSSAFAERPAMKKRARKKSK